MKKVVIIGAGPAGMTAAYSASQNGIDVVLVEKNERVGRKLLITGKGRCNITNNCEVEELIANVNTNGKFLYSAFYTFTNDAVMEMFESLGVRLKTERGNRVFPESDRAMDVVDAMARLIKRKNIKLVTGKTVKDIKEKNGKVESVVLSDGKEIKADAVIIATGGASYQRTGSTGDGYRLAEKLGHKITTLKPSLIGLEIQEDFVHKLKGLSLRNVAINVYGKKNKKIYDDFGEMEFTDYGVDGPIIKSASCIMRDLSKESYKISLDLKPALDHEKLDKRVQRDFQKYINKRFENSLSDLLPSKMIPVVVELSAIDPATPVNSITKEERRNLVNTIKNIEMHIKRYRPMEEAIVTSGGVKTSEINSSTMESKLVEGLYFAGEVIDVDAYTGGFNLQIAFSTGYLAGNNI
ncbi:NAD(P)/FAD-dependent oxidoreductase [Peptoclostridium sp. AF21-18]|uniref:NAD(P)/FAD-dependent oxidoreductase n=1 Tax=Peptoclostridium sp. AF21-18 TaxID=2292243 RepID=UPI000E4F0B58|nr:NAD(P)/FAD-dependent oxidoreductase [Peptoclostridium sp. AF21-18]RHQ95663.1 NAD(P)/FAD-dependent oxidoreductase [Peptoclostridium sp. AF21-18]